MAIKQKAFLSKGAEEVFLTGRSRRIGSAYIKRMLIVLDALNGATGPGDLQNAHGFHALKGDRVGSYAMSVSGNWRLTFRFEHGTSGDIVDVDFEDYH